MQLKLTFDPIEKGWVEKIISYYTCFFNSITVISGQIPTRPSKAWNPNPLLTYKYLPAFSATTAQFEYLYLAGLQRISGVSTPYCLPYVCRENGKCIFDGPSLTSISQWNG